MNRREEIQIIDLLGQRDQQLRIVARCEDSIRNILGGYAYPFPAPPDLPSRRPRKPSGKKQQAATPEIPRLGWLRKLEPPQENAYRLTYQTRDNTEPQTVFHTDYNLLANLAELELQGAVEILRLETGLLQDDETWTPRQVLLDRQNLTLQDV
jgi:hypothetical protein